MKVFLIVAVVAVIAIIGVSIYWRRNSPASMTAPAAENIGNESNGGPPAASSYGKGAASNANGSIQSQKIGVLQGQAKPAPHSTSKPNFTLIKVSISDPKTNQVLVSKNLNADGSYKFAVEPGEYVLNIVKGTGASTQLPQRIYVGPKETITVNFFVK